MKLSYIFVLLFTLSMTTTEAYAQRHWPRNRFTKVDTSLVTKYLDSLSYYRAKIDSVIKSQADDSDKIDARYYRLFVPVTFYHSVADKSLLISSKKRGIDRIADVVDKALLNVYLNRPDLVLNDETALNKTGGIRNDVDKPIVHKVELAEKTGKQPAEPEVIPIGLVLKRPNFWKFSGDYYLQFLQNFVTNNWYKGGESNYSAVGSVTLQANYNNKSKVKFENKIELKLGFQTSRGDTVHTFKTNNDLIRYTGRLGLQASKRWYYTLQLLAYTQFTQSLRSNDRRVYADFMSPFNLNLGVGMTYTVEAFNKKLNGTVNLSPLAFNFRYVDRKNLASRYGIRGHHRTMEDFGSQLTTDLTWKINDQVKWKTRLYGYTTFKRAEIECENTITLAFSKYISSNIFLYPRFDDDAKRDKKLGYWQFKEYWSLGFSYAF